ncbi:MAG: hypothetical protein ACJAVV_002203 [Alphaproteobacteria bacterium]|jgi:hypothetical protein
MSGQFQSCNPPFETEFGDAKPSVSALLCEPTLLPVLQSHICNNDNYATPERGNCK